MTEFSALDITKKAIIYRANHRGTKEADWVIGGFIRTHLDHFSEVEIDLLKILIDMDDESFFKQVETPDFCYSGILKLFKDYKENL